MIGPGVREPRDGAAGGGGVRGGQQTLLLHPEDEQQRLRPGLGRHQVGGFQSFKRSFAKVEVLQSRSWLRAPTSAFTFKTLL